MRWLEVALGILAEMFEVYKIDRARLPKAFQPPLRRSENSREGRSG